ncbi:hypothetical protein ACWEKT_10775 [Nocardia takedensis]
MATTPRTRRAHRWLALVFLAALLITIVGLAVGGPVWLSYLPIPPLLLLLGTGLPILVTTLRRPAATRATGWQRVLHRWSASVFAITVLATVVALSLPDPIVWVSYLPLLPLLGLLISGLPMLARPYLRRRAAATA